MRILVNIPPDVFAFFILSSEARVWVEVHLQKVLHKLACAYFLLSCHVSLCVYRGEPGILAEVYLLRYAWRGLPVHTESV